jgi:hypothetical protein
VTFPLEGTWEWRIEPAPFELMNPFEPISVQPAVNATMTESNSAAVLDGAVVQMALRSLGVVFLLGAVALAAIRWRKARRGDVLVESQ